MSSRILICTLLEPTYLAGLKALLNSLYLSGFRGKFVAGYKGTIESAVISEIQTVLTEIEVEFVKLETGLHLANFKPHFMLQLLERTGADHDRICYFDPDIVVLAKWEFYERWTSAVLAVCEDLNSPLAACHPVRLVWNLRYPQFAVLRQFESYVNSGFLSVPVDQREFLERWRDFNDGLNPCPRHELEGIGCDQRIFDCKADQDALNMTMERFAIPVSCHDRSAMTFSYQGTGAVMAHAIGGPKPWAANFLLAALQGRGPSRAANEFFRFVDGPLPVFSRIETFLKKFSLRVSSLIVRFYSRK